MNDISGTQRPNLFAAPASYLPQLSPRRRTALNAGVAVRALIALPAAFSLGVVLASAAHAQTVKTVGASSSGVNLDNGPFAGYKSFTITSGTTITNTAAGIYNNSSSGPVSISNAGSIASAGSNGADIVDGTITNSGTITGGSADGGYGVKINYGPSTLNNSGVITGFVGASANDASTIYNSSTGTITGQLIGAFQGEAHNNTGGTVINKGTIAATASDGTDGGVDMQGGYFNNSGIVLSNTNGLLATSRPLYATNSGKIIAGATDPSVASYGVNITGGGTITNTGRGTISGNTAGIIISGIPVAVSNNGGATITGGGFGIYSSIAGQSLTNSGTISQTATAGSTVKGLGTHFSAIYLQNGGALTNNAGGVVSGAEYGIRSDDAALTISNSGSIGGIEGGVWLQDGGAITNSSSAAITSSNVAVYNDGSIASFGNSGTIDGGVAGIHNDTAGSIGTLINSSGAISGGQIGILDDGSIGSLINNGVVEDTVAVSVGSAGTISAISNNVNFQGAVTGLYNAGQIGTLGNSGNLTGDVNSNGYGIQNVGSITEVDNVGNNQNISGGNSGFENEGTTGTINNNGLIDGTRFYGIRNTGTGDISLITNTSSGTISGKIAGILSDASAGSIGAINNQGSITGGSFGVDITLSAGNITNSGSINATAGTGIQLADGGSINNSGEIGGTAYGIKLTGAAANITNSGQVISTSGTGVFIGAAGSTLTNSGTVSGAAKGVFVSGVAGALTNSGLIGSSSGSAVTFDSGGTFNNIAGATIAGGAAGIDISGGAGTVSNAGLIGASTGTGLVLEDGGFVSNSIASSITSQGGNGVLLAGASATLLNSGVISGGASGATDGVYVTGGGSITNDGTITGNAHGIMGINSPVYVQNNGTILSNTQPAIDLRAGGTVNNSASGLIAGGVNGIYITGGAGTVTNFGTISTNGTNAIVLQDGGFVDNQGMVFSQGSIGIEISNGAGTLVNNGNIMTSTNAAVQFSQGGSVINNANLTISGATYGVHISGGEASITNFGTINATDGNGVQVDNGGTFDNAAGAVITGTTFGAVFSGPGGTGSNAGLIKDAGVAGLELGNGVSFTNSPTGTLDGTTGLIFSGTGSTLLNQGTIESDINGDAVSFTGSGINFLTLTTGQVLIGDINGGGSDSTIALDGTGTLTNTITDFGPTSALEVAPGADWTAYGNWQIQTATNDGTFQPGIIGTPLNLTGNFVQNPGGTLQVLVNPSTTNQLIATGSAKLSGALNYVFAPGTYVAKSYPFLISGIAAQGTFTTISYSGGSGAPTNLEHTTTYNTADGGNYDTDLVLFNPGDPAPTSDPLPLIVAPEDTSIFSDENQQSALNAQAASTSLLRKAAEGDQAGAEAAVCASEAGTAPASVQPNKASRTEQLANAVGNAFCGAGGWIQATGSFFNANGNANVDGYSANDAGFLAGIGKELNSHGTRLGVAVGYDESNVKTGLGSKGTIDTVRVGLYGSQPVGVFTIAGDLMYGHFDTTTSRVTGVGNAGSQGGGNIFSGGLEAETLLPVRGFDIIPGAGIRIASVSSDRFSESLPGAAGAFAVNGAGGGYTSVQPFVNLDLTRSYLTPKSVSIMPDLSVGYVYEAGTRGHSVAVSSQDGTTFETAHVGLAGSAAELQAGLSAGKGNWAFYARYTADLGGNWTSQAGEVGLRIRF
jgi:hypothetical protein